MAQLTTVAQEKRSVSQPGGIQKVVSCECVDAHSAWTAVNCVLSARTFLRLQPAPNFASPVTPSFAA